MRVLVAITRGERGGAQIHVLDLIRGLKGHFTFEVVVGDDEFLAEALRAEQIPVHVVPELEREVAPGRDLRALRSLRQRIRMSRPDVVHTHSTKAGLLGRLAAWLEGVPSVHTAHSWAFSDGIRRRRKAVAVPLEAAVARLTDGFIVVSEADKEVGLRYGVARPHQVHVVHNGVPDIGPRASPDAGDVPILTMVARMAAPKDHLLLLRSLSAVDVPFRVQFVGDGPLRAELEAATAELGLADRVEFLGVRADVPALLADSHVFALVSYQEGFPLSILEAMRAGLPVVASDVGGVSEAVHDGVTGSLVARDDQNGLARALGELLADADLRARQGRAGRALYEERFTVAQMVEKTADVYRRLA